MATLADIQSRLAGSFDSDWQREGETDWEREQETQTERRKETPTETGKQTQAEVENEKGIGNVSETQTETEPAIGTSTGSRLGTADSWLNTFEMTKTPHGWHFSKHFTISGCCPIARLRCCNLDLRLFLCLCLCLCLPHGVASSERARDYGLRNGSWLLCSACPAGESLKRRHDEFAVNCAHSLSLSVPISLSLSLAVLNYHFNAAECLWLMCFARSSSSKAAAAAPVATRLQPPLRVSGCRNVNGLFLQRFSR